jgi:hypothetical protein
MTCADSVCGTGGWSGPKPGDPDNFSVLTAAPRFGGVGVSWTYPLVNPFAVAHTILYKGTAADFVHAVRLSVVSGDSYFDATPLETALVVQNYYWIQFVSVNGTYGEVIGPASATARPTIDQTIEMLSGQIDRGVLAQALKDEISGIGTVAGDLIAEVTNRLNSDAAFTSSLTAAQLAGTDAIAYALQETTNRVNGQDALGRAIDAIILVNNTATAAILEEKTIRIAADSAIASSITTAQSTLNGSIATVQTTLQTNIDTTNDEVSNIGALYSAKVSVDGLIGGFGVYNDGSTVEAGFDVDKFWIGRTDSNKRKPFIVDGTTGEVFINEAVINSLTIDKLRTSTGEVAIENGMVRVGAFEVPMGNVPGLSDAIAEASTMNQFDKYSITIESTNGLEFRPGQPMATFLIAHVFNNGVEVTGTLSSSAFAWRRISFFPLTAPNDDATWNASYATGYKQISVTASSVESRATYHCDITI